MAWTPTYKVLDTRRIADNLLAYIDASQAEAFPWANGGQPLRLIQEFSDSVANRTSPVYPSIAFVSDDDAEDHTEDHLPAAYRCTFEVMVQSSTPTTAVSEAKKYAVALKSIIRNIPDATLTASTGVTVAVLEQLETGFEEIKTNEMQNDFLQVFQIRPSYTLTAAARV